MSFKKNNSETNKTYMIQELALARLILGNIIHWLIIMFLTCTAKSETKTRKWFNKHQWTHLQIIHGNLYMFPSDCIHIAWPTVADPGGGYPHPLSFVKIRINWCIFRVDTPSPGKSQVIIRTKKIPPEKADRKGGRNITTTAGYRKGQRQNTEWKKYTLPLNDLQNCLKL